MVYFKYYGKGFAYVNYIIPIYRRGLVSPKDDMTLQGYIARK